MKKIFFASLSLLATCTIHAGVYTFKMADAPADAKVVLKWMADGTRTVIDVKDGVAVKDTAAFAPQYVSVSCGRMLRGTLFLSPDKNLTVSISQDKREITGDAPLASINSYLLNTKFGYLNYQVAGRDEQDFINVCDSLYKADREKLFAAKLPESFTKLDEQRLLYTSYAIFPMYKPYHEYVAKTKDFMPTKAYFDLLDRLAVSDASLLPVPGYKEYVENAVRAHVAVMPGDDEAAKLESALNSVLTDATVKASVVHTCAYQKIYSSGLDGNDSFVALHKKYVSDADLVSAFNDVCEKWGRLRVGMPSPAFSCPDIEGKTVTLESLRGKLVYIDVWATWCGPCRGELPHLEKLEESYAGKDIHFVSISCDQNKAAWEKMVREKNMKGIQLYGGSKMQFMDDYLINGIPRFILLDREGRIVKADAPRPSNPDTPKLFDEWLCK